MKTLIIYCSTYKKHTEKIATVFAKQINAELLNVKNLGEIILDDYDLIGFGSGIYKESMAPQLVSCVKTLNIMGKSVFVFSTSGVGMKFYNKKLIKLLESKGAKCIGSFACKGSFISKDFNENKIFEFMSKLSKGHPNNKDLKNAEKFIVKVIQR